jgi:hypothetical protein
MKHAAPPSHKAEKAVSPSTANPKNVQSELNSDTDGPANGISKPLFALRPIRLTLELVDATHGGATAVAHSGLDQAPCFPCSGVGYSVIGEERDG